QVADPAFELLPPRARLVQAVQVALEGDLLGGVGKAAVGQPRAMSRRPGLLGVDQGVPQEEALDPLPRPRAIPVGRVTRPDKVAHRLVDRVGDPYRGEFSGAGEPGQRYGVAAVVLDPVAGTSRDERGGDDPAGQPPRGEPAVDLVTAGTGFVDELDLVVACG